MKELEKILEAMEPAKALAALALQLKQIFSHLNEEARISFVKDLIDGPGGDKVSSMVNL